MEQRCGRASTASAKVVAALLCMTAFASAPAAEPTPPTVGAVPAALADAAAASTASNGVSEPAIRRTVIDDRGSHIEELRVRGQLRSVIVSPKGAAPAYEIITNSDGRDLPAEGKTNSRGAAGKRVWSVLRF
ncbi:MAG: DUF2782 domain-containing protein [Pseudomonadota bacterium]|nr:DUF2782 domain-containing protein [Pseudomonadota bacterium]